MDVELCESNCSLSKQSGPLTVWPKTNSAGLNPVDSWTLSLIVNIINGKPSTQSLPVSVLNFHNMDLSVWWNLSKASWDSGWYALANWCWIPNSLSICVNTLDVKLAPQANWNKIGIKRVLTSSVLGEWRGLTINVIHCRKPGMITGTILSGVIQTVTYLGSTMDSGHWND